MMRLTIHPLQWAAICAIAWLVAGTACAAYGKTIHKDLGGPVAARMAEVDALRLSGERVKVKGTCASACTLYMGLPNACTTRGAEWRFHGPSATTRGLGLPFDEFERVSQAMARHYPEPVRTWFLSTGRHIIGTYYRVSGAALIDMGAIKECD